MNFKCLTVLAIVLAFSSCAKDKKTEVSAGDERPPSLVGFHALSGLPDTSNSQNVCPYVELEGYYKIRSSECSRGGKKAEVDYLLVPTRYVISALTSANGSVEAQFTRDGAELFPFSLDFPRIQTALNAKRQGVQCGADSEKETLQLYQACIGTRVDGPCFNAIVKNGDKLFAIVSRVRDGVQYWCKSSLRKVEDND